MPATPSTRPLPSSIERGANTAVGEAQPRDFTDGSKRREAYRPACPGRALLGARTTNGQVRHSLWKTRRCMVPGFQLLKT